MYILMKKIFYSVAFMVLFIGISFSEESNESTKSSRHSYEGYFTNELSFSYYSALNSENDDEDYEGYIFHLRSKLILLRYQIQELKEVGKDQLYIYLKPTGSITNIYISMSLNLILTNNMDYGASVTMSFFDFKYSELFNIGYGIWKTDYGKNRGFVFNLYRMSIPFHWAGNDSDAHLFVGILDVYYSEDGITIIDILTLGAGWGFHMW